MIDNPCKSTGERQERLSCVYPRRKEVEGKEGVQLTSTQLQAIREEARHDGQEQAICPLTSIHSLWNRQYGGTAHRTDLEVHALARSGGQSLGRLCFHVLFDARLG